MGSRNTPEQQREYSATHKERMRERGFVQRSYWIHREDVAAVKALVDELREKREQDAEK